MISKVDSEEKEFILMGNLNYNQLSDNPDCSTAQLNSICEVYHLQQVIKYPTRISGNPKEVWKTINRLMSRKPNNHAINELKINNESVVNQKLIAETLNKHFPEIGPFLADKLPETNKSFENCSSYK